MKVSAQSLQVHASRLCQLYESGVVLADLAHEYGCSHPTIRKVIAAAGGTIRPPHSKRGGRKTKRVSCSRCDILLNEAPEGRDGMCGWCIEEIEHTRILVPWVQVGDTAMQRLQDEGEVLERWRLGAKVAA